MWRASLRQMGHEAFGSLSMPLPQLMQTHRWPQGTKACVLGTARHTTQSCSSSIASSGSPPPPAPTAG
eukprot:CAMPEP_0171255418 /NCGR_PEP_ID=MMETSP0790-20130122/52760_1 /TAXON_ID=2925 /ORGANISM="Alexandrium catenella, Strain OF101" /LENGTH=67 /DNA_ID=CAMNT_0011723377 /DNA_START=91 /DNA_END=290 /DNA_ORIENTATION=+